MTLNNTTHSLLSYKKPPFSAPLQQFNQTPTTLSLPFPFPPNTSDPHCKSAHPSSTIFRDSYSVSDQSRECREMLERSDSFFKSSGTRFETVIWTAKLMLLSIGVVSTFLLLKVAVVPCIFQSIVPTCFGCVRACLAPPYIYIIVNFIIISIAASSSTSSAAQKSTSDANYEEQSSFVESRDVKISSAHTDVREVGAEIEDSDAEVVVVVKHEVTVSGDKSPPEEEEEEDDGYDDSLDGTWKAIMEGKRTVKKPFLKKSDTWNAIRAPPAFPSAAERVYNNQNHQKSEMRKSETFNDRITTLRAGGGLRRETLLTSQDSLNARVEAFINKFQNDMRMERQRSDMRYINLVKQQAAAT